MMRLKLLTVLVILYSNEVYGLSNNGRQLSPALQSALHNAVDAFPQLADGLQDLLNLNSNATIEARKAATGYSQILAALPGASGLQDVLQPILDSGLISQDQISAIGGRLLALLPQLQTNKCYADLYQIFSSLSDVSDPWALQFIDAMAKPGPSILRGNVKWMGNYRQCHSIRHADPSGVQQPITGNTCRMQKTLEIPGFSIPGVSRGGGIPIQLDLCMPSSCKGYVDIQMLLKNTFNVTIDWIYCNPTDLDIADDDKAIGAVFVLSVFAFLMLCGTLMDMYVRLRATDDRSTVIDAYASPKQTYKNEGFEMQETAMNGDVKSQSGSTANGSVQLRPLTKKPGEQTNNVYVDAFSNKPGDSMTEQRSEQANGSVRPISNGVNFPAYPAISEMTENESKPSAWTTNIDFPTPNNGNAVGKQNTANEKRAARKAKPEDDTSDLYVWQRVLLCFSLPKNTGRLLSVQAGRGNIGCLHGIRVLSLGWVILGHATLFMALWGQFANPMDVFALETEFPFQMIINATLSVDTFFFMSGFLTCFLFLKECSKRKKVSIKTMILYYFHRYWRLTPPLMIWIMIVACIIQYIGAGRPGWTDFASAGACRKHWWVNLLYINNVYDEGRDCVGVTWFLAHDMMYYVLAPLALVPLVYGAWITGTLVSLGMIAIHLGSTIWLVNEYNFDNLRNRGTGNDPQGYSNKVYFKPWARAGPFYIGVICGWLLHRSDGKIKMNKIVAAIGWMVAILSCFTLIFVTYDENRSQESLRSGSQWSVEVRTFFETVRRPAWAAVIGWIVLACASGYGGFVNSILAWDGWLPLSRLSYCAYLVHLSVMQFEIFGREATDIFTYDILIYKFLGYYVMAYGVAFLLSVTVEAPLLGLEKVMLGKKH